MLGSSTSIGLNDDVIDKDNNNKSKITSSLNIPQFAKINDTYISLWKGDITKLKVAGIVNPVSNPNLLGCNIAEEFMFYKIFNSTQN